ncbi:MAG: hypothetical protein ABF322_04390 [Lentimonas sp.]
MRTVVLACLLASIALFNIACTATSPSESATLASNLDAHARSYGIVNEPFMEFVFKQAWLETHEAIFLPALARVYAQGDGLIVLAILRDRSIKNTAHGFNQKTWTTGDVFEIFIEVSPVLYYEFHVTPENENLLLRWDPNHFQQVRRGEAQFESALIESPDFIQSVATINAERNYWTIYAFIPYHRLDPDVVPENLNWRIALARYDTTVGKPVPILSATPDLTEENFHDRVKWHPLFFGAEGISKSIAED